MTKQELLDRLAELGVVAPGRATRAELEQLLAESTAVPDPLPVPRSSPIEEPPRIAELARRRRVFTVVRGDG